MKSRNSNKARSKRNKEKARQREVRQRYRAEEYRKLVYAISEDEKEAQVIQYFGQISDNQTEFDEYMFHYNLEKVLNPLKIGQENGENVTFL